MTETRKQIIDIIEPYMDKTLVSGCFIKTHHKLTGTSHICELTQAIINADGHITTDGEGNNILRSDTDTDFTILGHYDITAVLKYIESKMSIKWDYEYMIAKSDWIDIVWNNEYCPCGLPKTKNTYGSIPNKPLNLYTEQEEKNLLELLELLERLGKI